MRDANNHQTRELTSGEARILSLIQEIYGSQNTPEKCFMSNNKEMVIFASDADGHLVIMVNLTFIANIAAKQKLTEKSIKDDWLIP